MYKYAMLLPTLYTTAQVTTHKKYATLIVYLNFDLNIKFLK